MPVSITLAFTPETLLSPAPQAGHRAGESTCAVMIDVLRASSVMTTAGAAGVDRIYTTASVDQALAVANHLRGNLPRSAAVSGQQTGVPGAVASGVCFAANAIANASMVLIMAIHLLNTRPTLCPANRW